MPVVYQTKTVKVLADPMLKPIQDNSPSSRRVTFRDILKHPTSTLKCVSGI